MKNKVDTEIDDELRAEYDLSQLKGGIRGKYVQRYKAGTNLVLLAPDVAEAFPSDEAVNEALLHFYPTSPVEIVAVSP